VRRAALFDSSIAAWGLLDHLIEFFLIAFFGSVTNWGPGRDPQREDTMRRFAWMGVVALAGLASVSCNDALEGKEVFTATLSGSEEVPARPTGASGAIQIFVEGNQVTYSLEIDDITSVTAAHIHAVPGAPGVNGPVRLFLYPSRQGDPAPQVSTTGKTILSAATVPSSNVNGITFEQLLDAMRTGNAYVNVHTTTFPGGEIRGTVRPQ
jgi:CHRD domain-containing protein